MMSITRASLTPGDRLRQTPGVFPALSLYRQVLRIRLVEEKIAELYSEQEMRCPVHLCIGQEAVAAGVSEALERGDAVMSGHRAHGHYLAKGGSLKRMMAEIYGRETGCSGGRGGSMHLIDLDVNFLGSTPIVSSIIPVATGVAWAMKMNQEKSVTVVYLGEGATEEGVWHESVNFASLKKLPIIYVCENNLYSVYTPLSERQPERGLTGLAAAHGLKIYEGDGMKASEVYEISKEAREYVGSGAGAVFMEFATYRWREHCGPNYDNDIGYRTEAEFEDWKKRDPLPYLENLVCEDGVSEMKLAQIRNEIEQEINEAIDFAKQSPLASDKVTEADVYS